MCIRDSHYVALVPECTGPDVAAVADACTRSCEDIRMPLSQEDRDRRLAAGLTQSQTQNMDTWGYPYVFEDFRFHMTLTGRLDGTEQAEAVERLGALYKAVDQPVTLDAVTLAFQPSRDEPFRVLCRFPIGASDLSSVSR